MRRFKIFAQRRKEMGDLLLAICIQKASSEPILLVAGDLKSPRCTKDPAGASLPASSPMSPPGRPAGCGLDAPVIL